jgi:hypothetical protein
MDKEMGGGLGYRATDCEDDALNWLEASVWSDLIVLSADELEESQIEWAIAAIAPRVKRLWLVGLEDQTIQIRLPRGWEGVDMVRPMEVGRLLANLRRGERARPTTGVPESLRATDPALFRSICWETLSEDSFAWVDRILAGSARRAAAYVKSFGCGRLPVERVWRDVANSGTDMLSLLRLRGCQIGLLHHGVVLFEDREAPLGETERAQQYEPLYRISDPESAAMAGLFRADPDHALRVSHFRITADSPATLAIDGIGQFAIPEPAQAMLRPQLARLRREGRGTPGCRFFPDQDWGLDRSLSRGAAFEHRIGRRIEGVLSHDEWFERAGLRMLDLRTLGRSDMDFATPLGRQLESAELLYEIVSAKDDLVVGGLDSQDRVLAERLIHTGHLEERAGRLGLTEAAAWSLYLGDELDLPCSGYRRPEVQWPTDAPLASA